MLNAPSLKQMIFAGFALVLLLLMLLAALAVRGTNTIGHDFTDYRQAARESLLVNEANDALLKARLAVMQFRATNTPEAVQQVNTEIDHLLVLKSELAEFVQDPSRNQAIVALSDTAVGYQAAFSEITALQAQRDALVPQLEEAGGIARTAISTLMGEAYNGGNADAAYLAGVVQQHVMLTRFYAEKYLLENLAVDQARVLSELGLANASAETLQRFVSGSALETHTDTYIEQATAFETLFNEISAIITERNALLNDQLDVLGPQLADGYAQVLQDVLETQGNIGTRAAAEVASVSRSTMGVAITAIVMGLLAAFFVGRILARTIARSVQQMTRLADGDLDISVEGAQRKDELGDIARALLVFQENGQDRVRMQAEQEQQAAQAEAQKRQSMNDMADHFETNVNSVVSAVSSAAEQMVGLAQMLSQTTERAGERSSAVASASEEASTNVETVAAASEEMTNSIAEVSQRVGQSATMTNEAAKGAERTTETVAKLANNAQTIGDVISMISDIAEQTNLLALNATIEAARAGEAGKGFAVVASEVKSLAGQTAKATEEISAQITGMQGDTSAVVDAIEKIGGMIEELNGTSSSIAAAVEEQHSATQEIARNTQQAADGTRLVSSNITEVSTAVQESGQAASEVLAASSQLASEAERLRDSVSQFLSSVRAA